jgi:GNAT superfamily N-acetyltransferase
VSQKDVAARAAAAGQSFAIRPARARELPALREIERAAGERFRQVGRPEVAEHAPPALEVFETARSERRLFVMDDGRGTPVGLLRLSVVDSLAHLDEISVHPSHGRRGLGARLVEFAVAWAAARGRRAVTLSTFADVPWNAPFYRRRGFRILEEHELTPGLRAIRDAEARAGLDVKARVFMRGEVQGPPGR